MRAVGCSNPQSEIRIPQFLRYTGRPAPGARAARLTLKPSGVVTAVNLRTKLLVVFVPLALVPLAVLLLLQYRAGAAAVENLLRERAAERASRVARDVEQNLSAQESRLRELARDEAVRRYALEHATPSAAPAASLEGPFKSYAGLNRGYLQSVTFLDADRRPSFRLNRVEGGEYVPQTFAFVGGQARHEEGVWQARASRVFRSPLSEESFGASLRLTAPVFAPSEIEGGAVVGTVVAEVRLGEIVREAGEAAAAGVPGASVVAL